MIAAAPATDTHRYARCIDASRRIRFDIDRDVIRGRAMDFTKKFLPDGLSLVSGLSFLDMAERRFFSQVQGRTYANMFGLVERFIGAKILEVSGVHWLGDQVALEALVRFADEEIKHQEMFRRIDAMVAGGMPAGYVFRPEPKEVARAVLGKSTWAVLALTCHIELFVLAHYRESIERDPELSGLWKDVFMHHAREESQHAILDELEWKREDARLSAAERDSAVDDLIGLVGAVDGLLKLQAEADAGYFLGVRHRGFSNDEQAAIRGAFLAAYRWQYIASGVQDRRFQEALGGMINAAQGARISAALAPILS